jgi:hypothetical protein
MRGEKRGKIRPVGTISREGMRTEVFGAEKGDECRCAPYNKV